MINCLLCLFVCTVFQTSAITLHVMPTSSGRSLTRSYIPDGSSSQPFFNLHDAIVSLRKLKNRTSSTAAKILLLKGIHELMEPVRLDGSQGDRNFIVEAEDGAILSGGVTVDNFEECKMPSTTLNIVCASMFGIPQDQWQNRHFYTVHGRAGRSQAAASILAKFVKPINSSNEGYVVKGPLPDIFMGPDASGIEFVFSGTGSPWSESRCTVDSVSIPADGENDEYTDITVKMKNPCFTMVSNKACNQGTRRPSSIENVGLDTLEAGQFYFSSSTGILVYAMLHQVSDVGKEVASLNGVYPVLEELVVGTNGVHDVVFRNVTFEYATWKRPSGPLGYVAVQSGALMDSVAADTECVDYLWTPVPGNIRFTLGPRNVVFDGCEFRHLGAAGVQFTGGAWDNTINAGYFWDISGAAVQIGGYNSFNETDPEKQELRNTVTDSLVVEAGVEFHDSVALSVGYSANTTLSHNELCNLTYGGINVGWGWSREEDTYAGGQVISYNNIHDFKTLLSDGGGIYVLGPQQQSIMNFNWIHRMGKGAGGGAYYPDEGSAYWSIEDNVFSEASFCSDNCEWLHIWTASIHDITTTRCFSDTTTQLNRGTQCPVTNITYVTKENFPPEAEVIMQNSGPSWR